jgi:hypothetical protein
MQVFPEQPASTIPSPSKTATTLTLSQVAGNLQLLLALRRSARNAELANWSVESRAA